MFIDEISFDIRHMPQGCGLVDFHFIIIKGETKESPRSPCYLQNLARRMGNKGPRMANRRTFLNFNKLCVFHSATVVVHK